MVRRLLVIALALLLAAQVIRNAAVSAFAETNAATAARIWPDHPAVELSLGMTAIGDAARTWKAGRAGGFQDDRRCRSRRRRSRPSRSWCAASRPSSRATTEPARRAFLAAEWRDPRSLPARYFLADQYLPGGRCPPRARRIGRARRLAPNGDRQRRAVCRRYAKDPRQLAAIARPVPFRSKPRRTRPDHAGRRSGECRMRSLRWPIPLIGTPRARGFRRC